MIQDGALGEYTGVPARKYAEKYPAEFFEYMNFDTSGQKYTFWMNAIRYSGYFDNDDYKKPVTIRTSMQNVMKSNCQGCNIEVEKRIEKFAADCFPDSEE